MRENINNDKIIRKFSWKFIKNISYHHTLIKYLKTEPSNFKIGSPILQNDKNRETKTIIKYKEFIVWQTLALTQLNTV